MRKGEINEAFSRITADESLKAKITGAMENRENRHKTKRSRYCAALAVCAAVIGVTTAFAASPAGQDAMKGAVSYISVIWIAALILFVIVEAATYQLVTIWFAVGSLGALVCSICGAGVPTQITVFLILSIVSLMFLRPVSKRYLKHKTEKTNVDSLVGMEVLITGTVNNVLGTGAGKLCGMEWTVRSADGTEIKEGETAVVEKIEGVKLIVKRKEN